MIKELKEIVGGLQSLVAGLRITIVEFFKPTVTVQYPHQTLTIPPRFRGHIELVRDPVTGKPACYACGLCQRACPSDCITVEGAKLEGAKKKSVSNYILDFSKCSLCGSCVDACRDGAIRFSREYNLATTNKEDYIMDLFRRLENEAIAAGEAPATPADANAPTAASTSAAAPATAAPAPAAASAPAAAAALEATPAPAVTPQQKNQPAASGPAVLSPKPGGQNLEVKCS